MKKKEDTTTDGILKSNVFLVIGTASYFSDAKCYAELELAKALKKPIRVALKEGTIIPEGFFDGIEDIKIENWSPDADGSSLFQATMRLLGRR